MGQKLESPNSNVALLEMMPYFATAVPSSAVFCDTGLSVFIDRPFSAEGRIITPFERSRTLTVGHVSGEAFYVL